MFKQLKTLAAGVALAAASMASYAAPWVDVYDPSNFRMVDGNAHTWTHNITDNGFLPGTDTVTGFTLSINLSDDSSSDSWEWARFFIPGYSSGSFEIDSGNYGSFFNISGSYVLNTLGMLEVTLRATEGDFMFNSSTLTAEGRDGNRVPEPASLALVGLALAGIGAQRKLATKK